MQQISLKPIKIGLIITLVSLLFGLGMGILFGVKEEMFKGYISNGVEQNITVHDKKSKSKIWRYAQRSHFHATGIAAYSFGLLFIVLFSTIKARMKPIVSLLIGLGNVYPLSWLMMFILAPQIGRGPAHSHIITEIFAFTGVGTILIAMFIICMNMFFGAFSQDKQ